MRAGLSIIRVEMMIIVKVYARAGRCANSAHEPEGFRFWRKKRGTN